MTRMIAFDHTGLMAAEQQVRSILIGSGTPPDQVDFHAPGLARAVVGAYLDAQPEAVSPVDVFLGGSCGGGEHATNWRKAIAIPLLDEVGITYYNPQIPSGQWSDARIPLERAAKMNARQLLIVITDDTRGTASILEAVEYTAFYGGYLHLVIKDIPRGAVIGGDTITEQELKDLNRGRAHLRDIVSAHQRHAVQIHDSINGAIFAIIGIWKALHPIRTIM